MPENNIPQIIRSIFDNKPLLKDIEPDADFFDLGASSLTIVDMQIQIEEQIDRKVETSQLMINPTINGWVEMYSEA